MSRQSKIVDIFQTKGSKRTAKEDCIQNLIKKRITEDEQNENHGDNVNEISVGVNIDKLRKLIELEKTKVIELEKKNSNLEKDNKDLKYLLNKSTNVNLQKGLLLGQFKKEIANKDLALDRLKSGISENYNTGNEEKRKNELLFHEFEGKIGNGDLVLLRSIGDAKKKAAILF